MEELLTIGLDIGNYDTKTQNTETPSGYATYDVLPYGTERYLYYNGKYYVPNPRRLPYQKDKTTNENAFILSLLGISAEILYEAERVNGIKEKAANNNEKKRSSVVGLQGEISRLKKIDLGIGLPPTHCATLGKKMVEYYKSHFGDTISYEYNGIKFSYSLNKIKYFPQDFAAVLAYSPKDREESAISYPSFYAVDIGGWTVDVVTLINNSINMDMCDSKPLGILAMYEKIIRDVELTSGKRLTPIDIESILRSKKTLLGEEVKAEVRKGAKEWYDSIMDELNQFGVDLEMSPVIFIGGGSQLFKKYIEEDKRIVKHEFISGANANAVGYEILCKKLA